MAHPCWEQMLLGIGIYSGTYREGATCFVSNGVVREKDKKLFDNARNVGVGGKGSYQDMHLL